MDFNKCPSVFGYIHDDINALSVHLDEHALSLFSKHTFNEIGMLSLGCKFKNIKCNQSNKYCIGFQSSLYHHLFSIGLMTDDLGLTFADQIGNHSIKYYIRFIPALFNVAYSIQYRYSRNNKKIGFLYDSNDNSLYARTSLLFFNKFKLKASLKFNGLDRVEKSFGFVFNL